MSKNGFEGWYFKHRIGNETIAFIPGRANGGAFIQLAANRESRYFGVSDFYAEKDTIRTGNCIFSENGITVDLPGIEGKLSYGPLRPLKSDIMGPFKYLPLECRHGVISMRHSVNGILRIDGRDIFFDGGMGYIEKDSGRSFPKDYLWLQCGDNRSDFDIMLSIAYIPFACHSFTGCICAVIFEGREYRLATYNGVKLLSAGPEHIRLVQKNLLLEIDISAADTGQVLKSPVRGSMSGMIRENNDAYAKVKLWENGVKVIDLNCENVGFEYVKA